MATLKFAKHSFQFEVRVGGGGDAGTPLTPKTCRDFSDFSAQVNTKHDAASAALGADAPGARDIATRDSSRTRVELLHDHLQAATCWLWRQLVSLISSGALDASNLEVIPAASTLED